MKLQAFSDTHGRHEEIQLDYADVHIFAGDHHCFSELQLAQFLQWFSEQPSKYKIFVPGNHDIYCEKFPEEARQLVEDHDIIYLCNEGIELEGHKFWGSPMTPIFCNWAFMGTEGQLKTHFSQIPDDVKVLITHGPPFGILDYCRDGHVGSTALNAEIYKKKPHVHIFGHIHGCCGRKTVGKTTFMNVSVLDDLYQLNNQPIQTLEII